MEEKVFFDGKFGKICGILNKVSNSKRIVIIAHGFSANKNTSARINADELGKIGVNTLRIDLDNCGESDLDFEKDTNITNYVSQVESSIEFLKNRNFEVVDLIGTSYAGMVVLITAMKNNIVRKIFLRAPMLDWESNFITKHGKEKLIDWENKGYRDYVKSDGTVLKSLYDSMQDTKQYRMDLHADKINNEIHVIQGNLDTSCPLITAQKIIPMFPNAKMHIIVAAGHNLGVDGDFSQGINIMKDFLKE